MNDAALQQANASFGIEANCILRNRESIDWNLFASAVTLLTAASRIAASGCGHSGIACQHFAHSLCCIERPARFLSPAEATHGGMGFLQENDVLVLASRGGKTEELLPMMEIASAKKVKIISITEDISSPIATKSDIAIKMTVERECDKYNSQGTSSFVALCAIFDAFQLALIEVTGYRNEQFALIHPGGAVGKRLNK